MKDQPIPQSIPDWLKEAAEKYSAYNYAKAPKQNKEDAEYVQGVSYQSWLSGAMSEEAKKYHQSVGMQDTDLEKLYEWLMDENRKKAETHFTSGVARNIAREFEFRLYQERVLSGSVGMRWVKVESEKDIPTEDGNMWLTEWTTSDDSMVVHTDYCDKWDILHHFKTPEIGGIRFIDESGAVGEGEWISLSQFNGLRKDMDMALEREKIYESLLDNLVNAIPEQDNDHDWWPDELTKAVKEAKDFLEQMQPLWSTFASPPINDKP